MNRPDYVTKEKRRAAKLTGKSCWFQKQKPENIEAKKNSQTSNPKKKRSASPQIPQKVESVMFCPYTPFSEL